MNEKGEQEARLLGAFLRECGLKCLYTSPMERAVRTAQIAAAAARVPMEERLEVMEKRPNESTEDVIRRFWPFWQRCVDESGSQGSIGIVTHGGPVWIMLDKLKMDASILEKQRHSYDGDNPLPPAGVWEVTRKDETSPWKFKLAFIPDLSKGG